MSEHNPLTPDDHGDAAELSRSRALMTDLADDRAQSKLDRILQWVPRLLASKPHIIALAALGVYLVLLPLFGVIVSNKAELIGGNYTNVTSDIGACVAAGGTLHLVNQNRKRRRAEAERLRLTREMHALLHHVHAEAAAELGHEIPTLPGDPRLQLVEQPARPGHGGTDGLAPGAQLAVGRHDEARADHVGGLPDDLVVTGAARPHYRRPVRTRPIHAGPV